MEFSRICNRTSARRHIQLGTDGRGPDQTVAGGRRGMDLEPAAGGEDGPLQYGWDPLRGLVAGPRPVVEDLSLSARKGTTPTASGAHRCSKHSCRLRRSYAEGICGDVDDVMPLSQVVLP